VETGDPDEEDSDNPGSSRRNYNLRDQNEKETYIKSLQDMQRKKSNNTTKKQTVEETMYYYPTE
jgi:predicted acetyltransferase